MHVFHPGVISFNRLLPESPRFLVSEGRIREANETIMRIAELNRKTDFDHSKLPSPGAWEIAMVHKL